MSDTPHPQNILEQVELVKRLQPIFMPHAARQIRAVYGDGPNPGPARFIHYTSAESALGIIRTKRFWMRNTNCMADYSEVLHGRKILQSFFSSQAKTNAFVAALDSCFPGAATEAVGVLDQTWNDLRFNTYIACLSEHTDKEDSYGRLSMWRAFGGNVTRVGIVIKIPSSSPTAMMNLRLIFSPVAYLSEPSAHGVLDEVIENVRANREFLCTVERQLFLANVFIMLLAGVVCIKHEGFEEEREWRAVYAPKRWPSPLIESSTEVVRGVPQIVHKIPLDAAAYDLLADLDLSRILDRIIVGPSPYPWPIYEAFVSELRKLGLSDAENRVFVSDIPIRG